MPVGSISKPFRYRGGYSFFKVVSVEPEGYKSFQDVKDDLKNQYLEDNKNEFISNWFQKVKKKYKIKLFDFA